MFLDQRIDKLSEEITVLGKRKEELRQERRQVLERTFVHTDQTSRFNLSLIQSDDDRLMRLINQVDLVQQGIAIIEVHHADIIRDLKISLAKEERVENNVIENEINHIVKKLLKQHYKEFLYEEDIDYLIKGISSNDYYKKEVGKLISEIIPSQTITQDLNSNLETINQVDKDQETKVIEKGESEKERSQLSEKQDQLKEDRSEASSEMRKVIEERDSLKEDQSGKVKEQEKEIEVQKVFEQEKVEVTSELRQVNAEKSNFEQVAKQEERQQKLSSKQQEVSISARDSIKELLARKRKEKELKNSDLNSPNSILASGSAFFQKKTAANDDKMISESKEKPSQNKGDQADHSKDANDDSSLLENRIKKLG